MALYGESRPSNDRRRRLLAAVLVAAGWFSAALWLAARDGVPGDFSHFYCGALILREAGAETMYDHAAMQQCLERSFPEYDVFLPFNRPPYYALLHLPFSMLPPRAALLTWLLVNGLAMAVGLALTSAATGWELSAVLWRGAIFLPAVYTFFNRQEMPILLVLAAGVYLLASRGKAFAAGALLSLCTIKFHLMLLVPLPFLVARESRVLTGLAAGGAFLAGVWMLMTGPLGILDYLRMLATRSQVNTDIHIDRMPTLWYADLGDWFRPLLVAVVCLAVAAAARRRPLPHALAAAWLGSLLVTPHIYLSDYLLALPACLFLSSVSRVCFWSSLFLILPIGLVLIAYQDWLVIVYPALALLCLLGAALPATQIEQPHLVASGMPGLRLRLRDSARKWIDCA